MSKAFDTVNILKLFNKLMLNNIPNIITTIITNYSKRRKAYTIFRNNTSLHDVNSKLEFHKEM